MATWTTKRVGEHPDVIFELEHGLTFAEDADVNETIERKYRLYDWLTNNDYANQMMLQSVIDQWSDYVNKLYATTQYEYDPIQNYDRHEEGSETNAHHKGSKRSYAEKYKDSIAVDRKNASAADRKTATATDLKTSTNTNTKEATATNLTETETPRVKTEEMHTGYGLGSDASGSPTEKIVTEPTMGTNQKQSSGAAANNYTETTGTAADNYSQELGTAANNYVQETAAEADNYTRETAAAADNYSQHEALPAENYETVTDIDANTYDKDVLSFTNRRTYGNIGTMTTQEMIQRERDIIVECLDVYVSKFAECFDLSTDILKGWLSNEDEPDWP